jgi:imidazolonepropionase
MPVLRNIAELASCPPENHQSDAGLVRNAALAWRDDTIEWSGPDAALPEQFRSWRTLDAHRRLVVPGLIDCHTHLCFGGWRGDEFGQRLAGASYQEIAAAGGGIARTVAATRGASAGRLARKAEDILDRMLTLGVTTVECKSGYGLDEANELKQLEVYRQLNETHAVDLVPTFLGAHIVPPEFREKREQYVQLLCDVLLPRVASQRLARFCDAFVEEGAFTANEGRRILEAAARLGLGLKLHADQLSDTGGASLAAGLGAVSAEHLEYVSEQGIADLAESGTVAVSLPLASLYLDEAYLPARRLLDAGVRVAVATDFNPGSAPSYHLPLAMLLACIKQSMTPQEVLNAVTTVAARAVSLQNEVGSLLPGYQADIAVIDAPDLNHWLYHFTGNACVSVFKRGTTVHAAKAVKS